jgi:hypothetical protein
MVEPRLFAVPPAVWLALHCLRMVPGVREALEPHSVLTVPGAVGVLIKAIDGVDRLSALPVYRAVQVLQQAWQVCILEYSASLIPSILLNLHTTSFASQPQTSSLIESPCGSTCRVSFSLCSSLGLLSPFTRTCSAQ